jgi:hypothetical protein
MLFINASNEYPRHIGDILLVEPDWDPEKPLPDGWEQVYETEPPQSTKGYIAKEIVPQRGEHNRLYQAWEIVPDPNPDFDIFDVFPETQLW